MVLYMFRDSGRCGCRSSPEVIRVLATVELLCVCEQVDVSIELRVVVALAAARHDGVGLRFAEVAAPEVRQNAAGAVGTEQLKVLVESISRPPLFTLAVGVL